MRRFIIVFIVAIMPGFLAAQDNERRLTLSGVGEVFVAPDMATVSLGVSSTDETASKAMRINSAAMAGIFAHLKQAGVEPRDIQTAQLSLNPRWEQKGYNNNPPRIIGYAALNTLTVRVRDLGSVGTVLDVLTQAGANRINHISFGIQNPRPHKDEARRLAVADARNKAELYAQAAGVELGEIIQITENTGNAQPRAMARMEMAVMDTSAVPVAEGELGLRAVVTIIFELK